MTSRLLSRAGCGLGPGQTGQVAGGLAAETTCPTSVHLAPPPRPCPLIPLPWKNQPPLSAATSRPRSPRRGRATEAWPAQHTTALLSRRTADPRPQNVRSSLLHALDVRTVSHARDTGVSPRRRARGLGNTSQPSQLLSCLFTLKMLITIQITFKLCSSGFLCFVKTPMPISF